MIYETRMNFKILKNTFLVCLVCILIISCNKKETLNQNIRNDTIEKNKQDLDSHNNKDTSEEHEINIFLSKYSANKDWDTLLYNSTKVFKNQIINKKIVIYSNDIIDTNENVDIINEGQNMFLSITGYNNESIIFKLKIGRNNLQMIQNYMNDIDIVEKMQSSLIIIALINSCEDLGGKKFLLKGNIINSKRISIYLLLKNEWIKNRLKRELDYEIKTILEEFKDITDKINKRNKKDTLMLK